MRKQKPYHNFVARVRTVPPLRPACCERYSCLLSREVSLSLRPRSIPGGLVRILQFRLKDRIKAPQSTHAQSCHVPTPLPYTPRFDGTPKPHAVKCRRVTRTKIDRDKKTQLSHTTMRHNIENRWHLLHANEIFLSYVNKYSIDRKRDYRLLATPSSDSLPHLC